MIKSAHIQNKPVDPAVKAKALNDYLATGNAPAVAKKYGVSPASLYNWKSAMNSNKPCKDAILEKQRIKKLEHALAEKDLENEILRDLLKKTYQVMPISLK